MSSIQERPKARRPTGLIIGLTVIVLLGFAYYLRVAAQRHTSLFSNDTATDPIVLKKGVPPELQTLAENEIRTFLDDINRQDYDKALKATAIDFPKPHTAAGLKDFVARKQFAVILTSPLKFESSSIDSHDRNLVLWASLRANGKPYSTACSLVKQQDSWLISNVLDPATPTKPKASSIVSGPKASS
jgi:hypothetical protein